MYFDRSRSFEYFIMFKIVCVICLVFCKFCSGFEILELQEFGARVRNLSLKLFHLTEHDTKTEIVLAPYTIWNLMSLVAFSASNESWSQLYSTIGISKQNEQHFRSIYKHVTNSLLRKSEGVSFETRLIVFYDANIKLSRSFKRRIINSGALLRMLHFNENMLASEIANDYMTLPRDLPLKRMIFNKSDFEESSMIVSGVVEFMGDWSLPFKESNTIRNGYNSSVYIMRQRAHVYSAYIEILNATATELNYGETGDFSMLIIRPHGNVQLKQLLEKLTKMSIPDILYPLYGQGRKEMDIEIPKFSITSVLVLNTHFMSMGMRDIFLPEQANFSKISSEDMYIFNFEHRAVLTVSEVGTVARAFTPGNLSKAANESELETASPFLFFIIHGPSMSILFCGKYGK